MRMRSDGLKTLVGRQTLPKLIRCLKWSLFRRSGHKSIVVQTDWGYRLSLGFLDVSAPHIYFSHTGLFAIRVRVEGSTGRVLAGGIRTSVGDLLNRYSRRFSMRTGDERWERLLPRNYFILAAKSRA